MQTISMTPLGKPIGKATRPRGVLPNVLFFSGENEVFTLFFWMILLKKSKILPKWEFGAKKCPEWTGFGTIFFLEFCAVTGEICCLRTLGRGRILIQRNNILQQPAKRGSVTKCNIAFNFFLKKRSSRKLMENHGKLRKIMDTFGPRPARNWSQSFVASAGPQ